MQSRMAREYALHYERGQRKKHCHKVILEGLIVNPTEHWLAGLKVNVVIEMFFSYAIWWAYRRLNSA